MSNYTPTEFIDMMNLQHGAPRKFDRAIALDTETSGLHPDDGARVSTVSIAFAIHPTEQDLVLYWTERIPGQVAGDGYVVEAAWEDICEGERRLIVSAAWPFDQGVEATGKPEDDGSQSLFPETANQPQAEWEALTLFLSRPYIRLVFHHAKFDIAMMRAGCRRWPGLGVDLLPNLMWDTQNVCAMMYAPHVLTRGAKGAMVPSTALKPTSMWLWGVAEGDEQKIVKEYLRRSKLPAGRWDLIPWNRIGKYAGDDARLTIRLSIRQTLDMMYAQEHRRTREGLPVHRDVDLLGMAERRLEVSRMLIRVERNGVPFNLEAAAEGAKRIYQEMDSIKLALPFKPSLPAAKDYWFTDKGMGLEPYDMTEKGSPVLTKHILQEMVKDHIPAAAEYAEYQHLSTALSRWYEGWASMAGSDGRLHPTFRQNGTVSGRFSVERIQLQAIPHDYRVKVPDGVPTPRDLIELGVPEGYKLWELDLANAEARCAAVLARCTPMLEAFEQGRDVHGDTAQALFHVKPEDDNWGQMRTLAKRGNFSFIFGVGADTFQDSLVQEGINIPIERARQIVTDWNALYPQYRHSIEGHDRRVADRVSQYGVGWVDLRNEERRYFVEGEDTHKAFNQRVQGNLAQLAQDWWLQAVREVADDLDSRVQLGRDLNSGVFVGRVGAVLMVHDSLDLLVPDDDFGREIVQVACEIGNETWKRWFPEVPGHVDASEW